MDDLIAFLAARLDEDETVARDAFSGGDGSWRSGCEGWDYEADRETWDAENPAISGSDMMIYDEGGHTWQQATHIARHDPARVLREVEAGRRIIRRYEVAPIDASVSSFVRGQDNGYQQACLDAIQDLASAWSDHPDYRLEWAVTEPAAS